MISTDFRKTVFGHIAAPTNTQGAWRRITLDIDHVPATINLAPSRLTSILFFLVGGSFLFLAVGMVATGQHDEPVWFLVVFAVIGVLLLVASYALLSRKFVAEFGHDQVSVASRSVVSRRCWTSEYSDFEKLLLYSHTFKPEDSPQRTFVIVELTHLDPEKSIPIFAAPKPWDDNELISKYQQFFGLPLIDNRSDKQTTAS